MKGNGGEPNFDEINAMQAQIERRRPRGKRMKARKPKKAAGQSGGK